MTGLRDLEVTPSAEFATRLESLLLSDLRDEAPAPQGLGGDESHAMKLAPIVEIRSVEAESTESRSLRFRPMVILATAAVIIALIVEGVWSARHGSVTPVDTTRVTAPVTAPTSLVVTSPALEYAPISPTNDEVAPGDYAVTHFAVPFTISTTGPWIHEKGWLTMFSLLRLTGPKFAVTSGLFVGATPLDVIANFCPSALEFPEPVDTMLLDQPALQVTARATASCAFPIARDTEGRVRLGDEVQLTVASVDGNVIVVVANALWPLWPALEPEIAALLESMHPVN